MRFATCRSCGTEEVELCPLCKNDLGEHCEEAVYSDTIQRNNKVVKCNHFKLVLKVENEKDSI